MAWRTGANEPTILELTAAAKVAGVSLTPSRYVILTVPGPHEWLVLFHAFDPLDDPARIFQTLVETGRGRTIAEPLTTPVETFRIRAMRDSAGPSFLLEWGRLRTRLPVQFAP